MIFYGQRLVAARHSRGLSRKDLAVILGIPVTRIRAWEREEAQPRVSLLKPLDEYGNLLKALAYPSSFFRTPPEPFIDWRKTSLAYHGTAYECDRCDEPIDAWLLDHPERSQTHYHPGCPPEPGGGAGRVGRHDRARQWARRG